MYCFLCSAASSCELECHVDIIAVTDCFTTISSDLAPHHVCILVLMSESGRFFSRALHCRVLAYRLRQLSAWEYTRMFMFQPGTISAVASLLGLIFMSRCIFNFLTVAGVIDVEVS